MPGGGIQGIHVAVVKELNALAAQLPDLQAQVDAAAAALASVEAVIASYGVTNAYTKAQVDTLLAGKVATSALTSYLKAVDANAAYAPRARNLTAAGLLTGGGDLSANRTFTVEIASENEATAGVRDDKAMTPLKVAAAIAALTQSPVKALQFFEGSGTYIPGAGVTRVLRIATGGGAGGSATLATAAGGGATVIDLSLSPSTEVVTIGAGGALGTTGGATSIGSGVVAAGGRNTGQGGRRTDSTGQIRIAGGNAAVFATSPAAATAGGASFWGGEGAFGTGGFDTTGYGGCALFLEF